MSEWLSLDSVPRDGTTVDLWARGAGHEKRLPDCRFERGVWISPTEGDWEYGGGRLWGYEPLYWMLPPEPPAPQPRPALPVSDAVRDHYWY